MGQISNNLNRKDTPYVFSTVLSTALAVINHKSQQENIPPILGFMNVLLDEQFLECV